MKIPLRVWRYKERVAGYKKMADILKCDQIIFHQREERYKSKGRLKKIFQLS